MKIGMAELLVVFIVALVVIGPDKLPVYAKKLGEALAQFRKYSEAATKDIKESIVEPLEEAQRPLREAMEPLNDLDKAVRGNVKDVRDSLNGLGRPKKETPLRENADTGSRQACAEPEAENKQTCEEPDTGSRQTCEEPDTEEIPAGMEAGPDTAQDNRNTEKEGQS